jgi:hypothetical protein
MSYVSRSWELTRAYAKAREALIRRIGERLDSAGVSGGALVVYGAGTHTAELIQSFPWLMDSCVAFVDGNRDLQGHRYFDRPVLSPACLGEIAPEHILISAREAEAEIAAYLGSMGLDGKAVRLYGGEADRSAVLPEMCQ